MILFGNDYDCDVGLKLRSLYTQMSGTDLFSREFAVHLATLQC